MKDNKSDWSTELSFECVEKKKNPKVIEGISGDSYEALTRFYQKSTTRSKAAKSKKPYWQETREY